MQVGDKVCVRSYKTRLEWEDGRVVAEETSHVLVEYFTLENRWGGLEREWVPKGAFVNANHLKAEVWV